MIVIDTHVLVWVFQADRQSGPHTRQLIDEERASGIVMVPAIMPWEAAMLVDKGRPALEALPGVWFDRVFASKGFALASLDVEIGMDAGTLPAGIHGDPADRIIIATARALQAPLLTADEKILACAAAGHVKAIDARH